MSRRRARQPAGLSLIELLIVIAILAAVSGLVLTMTDKMDERSRFDETSRRLVEIRSAILGPDAVSSGGDLLAGGYLQDVGWLPDSSLDLLRAPEVSSGTAMPKLTYFPLWKTWAGWRGPYLAAPPQRASGGLALYDDYGHDFYGWSAESTARKSWEVPRLSGTLAVRTCGADGVADADGGKTGAFERDYPTAEQPLVPESDWVTDLRGLQVELTNLTDVSFFASPIQVCLRIMVPRWNHDDPLGYWPADADDEFVGTPFTLDLTPGSSETGGNVRVISFASGRSIRIPNGRRMLFLVDASTGQPLAGLHASAELLVSRRVSPPSVVRLSIRRKGGL
jgi:prepilin-type N-terminal cleavage/methylation domain-containing protein